MLDRAIIMIGTTKGAFLLSSDSERADWSLSGPFCGDGWSINHVVGDPESGAIWAAGGGDWTGAGVWRSDNGGESWALSKFSRGEIDKWCENDPNMAEMFNWEPMDAPFTGEVNSIWSLGFVHGRLWAGTKPAALFCSADGGRSWKRVEALTNHPSREDWNPGAAGLVLHTIVADPVNAERMWVGISATGVFATEDGGKSWDRRNRLSNADACEHHDHPAAPSGGETGLCVHNMMRARTDTGDLLYQQNHHGVYRSSDGGRIWHDITEGLPSTFGFPIAVHPRDTETVWVFPLNGDDQGRFPPDASDAVWKSGDGGGTWTAKRKGLPERDCFFTVLRQAMAVDSGEPTGVYFGTNTGSVFASADEGKPGPRSRGAFQRFFLSRRWGAKSSVKTLDSVCGSASRSPKDQSNRSFGATLRKACPWTERRKSRRASQTIRHPMLLTVPLGGYN